MSQTPTDPEGKGERRKAKGENPGSLRPLSLRGNILVWGLSGAAVSLAGLFLLTGLTPSVWLFLLYPLLIGGLLFSLLVIGLHLLRRFGA